jgi:hypothetical protein
MRRSIGELNRMSEFGQAPERGLAGADNPGSAPRNGSVSLQTSLHADANGARKGYDNPTLWTLLLALLLGYLSSFGVQQFDARYQSERCAERLGPAPYPLACRHTRLHGTNSGGSEFSS